MISKILIALGFSGMSADLIGVLGLALSLLLLVWFVLRPLMVASVSTIGVLKYAYLATLCAAFIVATFLVISPQQLTNSFPGWKGSAGGVLLLAACIGVSKALWRMLRATVFVGIWGAVSLVLASSIFFDKLPQNINRGDLLRFRGIFSSELVLESIAKLQVLSLRGIGALRLIRINSFSEQGINQDQTEAPTANQQGVSREVDSELRSI